MAIRTRIWSAAVAAVLLALASGCATVGGGDLLARAHGPELSVNGRISIRQLGRPTVVGSYEWHRGDGFNGWTESMVLRGPAGQRVFKLKSDDAGTIVQYADRTRKVQSVRWLVGDQLGVDVPTATLAGWVEGVHLGAPLDDRFLHGDIGVEVLERRGDGRPTKLRLVQADTVVLMTVRREFA